jgi:hypothetical protein
MSDVKVFTIMFGLAFIALFMGMGFSQAAEHEAKAKAKAMIACFKAGKTNCDVIVERAFR